MPIPAGRRRIGRLLQRFGWKGADKQRRLHGIAHADKGRRIIFAFYARRTLEPNPLGHVEQTRVLQQLRKESGSQFGIPLGARWKPRGERSVRPRPGPVRTADGGTRPQANLDALVRRARPYAVRGLFAFAAMLQAKWADVMRTPYRDWPEGGCDDGEDAVALRTVHNAKGLEWPVVIVVNSVSGPKPFDDFLHRRSDGTMHGSMPRVSSRGHADAKSEEVLEERRERVRLWYVACTRARDLLILPRLPRVREGAWASLVNLRMSEFPPPLIAPRPVAGEAEISFANRQSAAVFAQEAERVVASAPAISWLRLSSDDPDRRRVAPSAIPDPEATVLADVAGAGRPRGAAIHKLIEELLNGELAGDQTVVHERAVVLLAQLADYSGPIAPDPAEVASTAKGALALPAVAEVRDRLVPEWPIHVSLPDGTLVAGRADAVALGAAGVVDIVFDWKSDVEPEPASRQEHAAQMSAYVRATGAARGAIVYLSRSEIVWVYPK